MSEKLQTQYDVSLPKRVLDEIEEVCKKRRFNPNKKKKLIDADILDAYDLVHANLNDLSRKVSYSKKALQKWQDEAKKLRKTKT